MQQVHYSLADFRSELKDFLENQFVGASDILQKNVFPFMNYESLCNLRLVNKIFKDIVDYYINNNQKWALVNELYFNLYNNRLPTSIQPIIRIREAIDYYPIETIERLKIIFTVSENDEQVTSDIETIFYLIRDFFQLSNLPTHLTRTYTELSEPQTNTFNRNFFNNHGDDKINQLINIFEGLTDENTKLFFNLIKSILLGKTSSETQMSVTINPLNRNQSNEDYIIRLRRESLEYLTDRFHTAKQANNNATLFLILIITSTIIIFTKWTSNELRWKIPTILVMTFIFCRYLYGCHTNTKNGKALLKRLTEMKAIFYPPENPTERSPLLPS